MGKLRSYLSQVQDFIANPISRNVMLNDLYQEALEFLFNDNKEEVKEAVVLKVFPQNQTAGDLKEGSVQYQSAVLRIPGIHDCLPDPARLANNSSQEEVGYYVQLHGVCFSREPVASVESTTSPSPLVKVGDVVKLEYVDGVARFGEIVNSKADYANLDTTGGVASEFKKAQVASLEDLVGKEGKDISTASLEAASKNPGLTGQKITNGKLPKAALSGVPGKKDRYGRDILVLTEVADELLALMNDFKEHFGFEMSVSSHYRTYERQVATKERWTKKGKPKNAATPGTSTHGWGLAIDIDTGYPTEIKGFKYTKYKGGTAGFHGEIYKWMFANAPKRGWWNPSWAQEGGSIPESWHFEVINRKKYLKIFAAIETVEGE